MSLDTLLPRELPPGYTVVEFGVGSYPFRPAPTILHDIHWQPNTAWSFTEGRSYTAVDSGEPTEDHSYAGTPEEIRQKARFGLAEFAARVRAKRPGEDIKFLFADATSPNLTIPPSSANLLYMCDVLSSNIDNGARTRLLTSAQRLLVAGGLLAVRETFTPWLHDQRELTQRLGTIGFQNVRVVTPEDPAHEALVERFGASADDVYIGDVKKPNPYRYFCFATTPDQ